MQHLWLKKRIKELNVTQYQIAKRIHMSPSRLSDIITGKRTIKGNEIISLSHVLDIPEDIVKDKLYGQRPYANDDTTRVNPHFLKECHQFCYEHLEQKNIKPSSELMAYLVSEIYTECNDHQTLLESGPCILNVLLRQYHHGQH